MNSPILDKKNYCSPCSQLIVLYIDHDILVDSGKDGSLEDYDIIDFWEI